MDAARSWWWSLVDYSGALYRSWWLYVGMLAAVYGLASPFFPPLTSAIPVWVAWTLAIAAWTVAPFRAYHKLRIRMVEGSTVSVVQGSEGLFVNAPAPGSMTVNYYNQYFQLAIPSVQSADTVEDDGVDVEGDEPVAELPSEDTILEIEEDGQEDEP